MRLLRLLRLAHIASFMQKMAKENLVNASVLRMIFLGFWVTLFAHFAACGWIALGAGNIGPEWTSQKELLYLRSFYWAVTTIATIGYGDVTPITPIQTIFTISVQLIGAGLYGYVIAIFASLIANLDSARKKFSEQMDEINTFMRFRKIPLDLQKQIRSYYDYLWESRRGYSEAHVLADLPDSLRLKVSIFTNKSMLEKVPIFEGAGDALVEELLMHLKPAEGTSQPVGRTIVDYMFPGDENGSIPLIGITGSSGTTEVSNLIFHLLKQSGDCVALANTSGLCVGNRVLHQRDSANWKQAQRVLLNKDVEAAVIENQGLQILTEGLAYEHCSVGIVTNIAYSDAYKHPDVAYHAFEDAKDLIKIFRTQVDVVYRTGHGILNAQDENVVALAEYCDGEVIFYASSPDNKVLQEHLAAGKRVVTIENACVILMTNAERLAVFSLETLSPHIRQTPQTLDTILASAAAAWVSKLSVEQIRAGLTSYVF
jgi:hypothetical protein